MTTIIFITGAATLGYLASIVTWPRLRQALIGVENEIDDLRTKARALESELRG